MSDNQIGGDGTTVSYVNGLITSYQSKTLTPSGQALDVQENKSLAGIVTGLTNEKNRLGGSLYAAPTGSGLGFNTDGGSKVAQVNVGARQW